MAFRNHFLVLLGCVLPILRFEASAETPGVDDDGTFLGMEAIERPASAGGGETPDGGFEFYRCPMPEALPFRADGISLSPAQTALLIRALDAVACNFPAGTGKHQVPMGVKQMAIALALRLDTHDENARLAEYLLRRNRSPRPLPESEARETLAAKLWNAAFGLHRYAKTDEDRALAACLFDLATRFDPEGVEERRALETLELPDAALRWREVTEIPDLAELLARHAPPVPPQPSPAVEATLPPAAFAFAASEATLAIFAPVTGDRFSRLDLRVVTDRSRIPGAISRSGQPLGLYADKPGAAFGLVSDALLGNVLARIDERLPEWRSTGSFLHFTLGTPFSVESERNLAPAAVVLAELLANGEVPNPGLAVGGTLGADGVPEASGNLAEAIASGMDGSIRLVALPANAEAYLADLVILGDLEPLLSRQYLAFSSFDELLAMARRDCSPAVSTGLAAFEEIQQWAGRRKPSEILANRQVRERLGFIVRAMPNHLSARYLLLAALDRIPPTLSLQGSASQLRAVEQPLRDLIRNRLRPTPDAPTPEIAEATALFSKSEFDLRKLRPVLHADARAFADSLAQLIDDLRIQIRSDATRSAVFLQEALEDLELQVAQFAGEE